ncbi:hypothetical protein BACEGG_01869 [Bacteroides eggerthii DSM 20697]|nr:hypothetical protein BACEGG_01869 [Bacteroides eggerthii DSM 20697]
MSFHVRLKFFMYISFSYPTILLIFAPKIKALSFSGFNRNLQIVNS